MITTSIPTTPFASTPLTRTPFTVPSAFVRLSKAAAAASSFACSSSNVSVVFDSSQLFFSGFCGYSFIFTIRCFSRIPVVSSAKSTVSPRPYSRILYCALCFARSITSTLYVFLGFDRSSNLASASFFISFASS